MVQLIIRQSLRYIYTYEQVTIPHICKLSLSCCVCVVCYVYFDWITCFYEAGYVSVMCQG